MSESVGCMNCGRPIPEGGPFGLCPHCLIQRTSMSKPTLVEGEASALSPGGHAPPVTAVTSVTGGRSECSGSEEDEIAFSARVAPTRRRVTRVKSDRRRLRNDSRGRGGGLFHRARPAHGQRFPLAVEGPRVGQDLNAGPGIETKVATDPFSRPNVALETRSGRRGERTAQSGPSHSQIMTPTIDFATGMGHGIETTFVAVAYEGLSDTVDTLPEGLCPQSTEGLGATVFVETVLVQGDPDPDHGVETTLSFVPEAGLEHTVGTQPERSDARSIGSGGTLLDFSPAFSGDDPVPLEGPQVGDTNPSTSRRRDYPTVPGYEISAILGRGGMGVVYKALQIRADRLVALKMIRGDAHVDPAQLERFRVEGRAVGRLRHPNIVQISMSARSVGCLISRSSSLEAEVSRNA